MISENFIAGNNIYCSYCGNPMIHGMCLCEKAKRDMEIQNLLWSYNEELMYLKREILPRNEIRKIQIKYELEKLNNELKTL